jgi:hypothetical protein
MRYVPRVPFNQGCRDSNPKWQRENLHCCRNCFDFASARRYALPDTLPEETLMTDKSALKTEFEQLHGYRLHN